MTAAYRVVSSPPPRARRGVARPRSARWPDARARATLAALLGGLAGAAVGIFLGIHAPATDATTARGRSAAEVDDGLIAVSSRPAHGSVAAALAPAIGAGAGTAEPAEEGRR